MFCNDLLMIRAGRKVCPFVRIVVQVVQFTRTIEVLDETVSLRTDREIAEPKAGDRWL